MQLPQKISLFRKNTYVTLMRRIQIALISDAGRLRLLFIIMNFALSIVSFTMTCVNFVTKEYVLLCVTLIFSILCFANAIITIFTTKLDYLLHLLFAGEALLLLAYFFISGTPDGFSVLWTCLVPSFSMLLFGLKIGARFSFVTQCMMLFFLWVPLGKSLLLYDYNETFMLRFPFLYLAIFIISAIMEYIRQVTYSRLKDTNAKYEHLYRHDALTGLYNRYGMQEYFDNLLVRNRRENTAIIMLDIDNFKRVNDTYGHECGDVVLKVIGSIPGKVMCEHSHICRWGGEEFVLLMQCEHEPPVTAEKVRAAIEKTEIDYNGEILHVTVSVGVGIAPSSVVTPDNIHDLIDLADEAMYESKKNGKNRVTVKHMQQ